jgi:hypothetical protein
MRFGRPRVRRLKPRLERHEVRLRGACADCHREHAARGQTADRPPGAVPLPRPLPARSSRRGENSITLRRASNCARHAPPSPGLSPPNCRGERSTSIALRHPSHCVRGPPPPGPLPRQTAPGEGENSIALRQSTPRRAIGARHPSPAQFAGEGPGVRAAGERSWNHPKRQSASALPHSRTHALPSPALSRSPTSPYHSAARNPRREPPPRAGVPNASAGPPGAPNAESRRQV